MINTSVTDSVELIMEFMNILNPNWVTGFVDGEGCFHVRISKRKKLNVGIEIGLSFSISQKKKDIKLLEDIKSYFKCGGIRINKKDGCAVYEVRNIKSLLNILKHFDKYPLKSRKLETYIVFVEIYKKVSSKEHLSKEGIREILDKAYCMNPEGKRKLSKKELLRLISVKDIV